jgi:pimeloyl-ACP methyl ester carboxylesterase
MGKEQKARKLWFPPGGFKSQVTDVSKHQVHCLVGNAKSSKFFWFQSKKLPIIMIHGALASRRYLLPTARLLMKHMPVYVLDLPGHGASSKPIHALSVEEQAKVLSKWLDANKLKKVHVFANSYGCQIAAQLACDRPDVMAKLILTGSTVDPAAPTFFQQWFRLHLDGLIEPLSSQVQMLVDISDMGIVRAFETAGQMMRNDIRKNLPRIKCRTLIVRGENDPIASQQWTEHIAKLIPHAKWAVIPHAPHCINYTSAVELSKMILDFIS